MRVTALFHVMSSAFSSIHLVIYCSGCPRTYLMMWLCGHIEKFGYCMCPDWYTQRAPIHSKETLLVCSGCHSAISTSIWNIEQWPFVSEMLSALMFSRTESVPPGDYWSLKCNLAAVMWAQWEVRLLHVSGLIHPRGSHTLNENSPGL